MEESRQLEFDFPLPKLEYRQFLDLKYEIKSAENDWVNYAHDNKPDWLLKRKAQFRALCGARGHKGPRPWDNGLWAVFIECDSCGARIDTKYY
jgi:hypothetical protein